MFPTNPQPVGATGTGKMAGKEYAFYDRKTMLMQQGGSIAMGVLWLLFSAAFWVLIIYGMIEAVFYTRMYMRITKEADLETICEDDFGTQEQNFKRVMEYPRGEAWPYIQRFASERQASGGKFLEQPDADAEMPPLVTGVSSATFFTVQALVRHYQEDLLPNYPKLKLVIYNLGLYNSELTILRKYCHCMIRSVEHSIYPSHIADTNNFAWRPLIMQLAMEEFGSVMYIDPTYRVKSATSLNTVKNRGKRNFFVWDIAVFKSIIAYTNPETFVYLGEKRCTFRESGMVDTGFIVAWKSNETWQLLMKPWLKCALSPECIEPPHSTHHYCFNMRHPKTTGCHCYDQSALSISLNRALQLTLKRDFLVPPRVAEEAEPHLQEVKYFDEQPWTNRQLYFIFGAPIVLYFAYKGWEEYKKPPLRRK